METTETGTPAPTITLTTVPGTPARTLSAAAHYPALLAELGSGPTERWTIGIGLDQVNVARVVVQPCSNDADEVARARAVLEDVLAAAQLARPVPPPSN